MPKIERIIYWVSTLWLAAGMVATGVQQLLQLPLEGVQAPPGAYGLQQLGYPAYLLTLLGVAKLFGVLVLLLPRLPLVKEWAYAGFTFLLGGAIWSHIAVGHGVGGLFPAALLLVMLVASWLCRPPARRMLQPAYRA